ncbi:small ribosomal subunit protein mS35 [Anguilla rostrata]|uniref:small ribosomal subunit protein mS35 n=1 Tax=Anguilla rostrata TaxID=7938 RepID=UPI0030CB39E5
MMAASTAATVMSSFCRKGSHLIGFQTQNHVYTRVAYSSGLSVNTDTSNKGFPRRGNRGPPRRVFKKESGEPRTERMAVDQDWTSVYPTAAPFKHATVPLPVRMGYPVKRGVPPAKKGNLELIKIPNFLHLTPAAIKKHCEALKPFCTEWPQALDSDAKCEEFFPIRLESKNFASAGTSLRNPQARVVTLKVKLSSLNLDDHARKKMIKLVGHRYNRDTDELTLNADRCPLRKQNCDYAMYLLTVLYHESWKVEPWEEEKTREDMEEYSWEDSPSQSNVLDSLLRMRGAEPGGAEGGAGAELLASAEVQAYGESVSRIKNEGESESSVLQYREAVKRMLNL